MVNDPVLYNIKVYNDDLFVGYIKSYRKFNNLYRFEITKNFYKSLQYKYESDINKTIDKLTNSRDKLTNSRDKLLEIGNYTFKLSLLTDKEIRKSKLNILKIVKIRKGIFKR